jgi:hypothetical protein
MEELVGLRVDSSVQPVPFGVASNHCPVNHGPSRSAVARRLYISRLHPAVNSGTAPIGT